MSMFSIFDIAGSALSAQSQRMNVTASNLANADTTSGPDNAAYRARQVVFESQYQAGSNIGGIQETQEMLDFCAKKNILPECEMIRMDQINEAFERMQRSDVRYRFVIDMASL